MNNRVSDQAQSELRLLLLADSETDRNRLRTALSERLPSAEIRASDQIEQAAAWSIREVWVPDLVILSVGYSQAWSNEELVALWNAIPLARWICIHDGWTRSALRHLPQLPAACCIPRERFEIRLRQELAVLQNQREPLPLTASLDEMFALDAELATFDLVGMPVAIFTPDRDLRDWLGELLRSASAVLVSLEQQPQAVLWDLDPAISDRVAQIAAYRCREPGCLIVGLRNTVHELFSDEVKSLGVDLLVPKHLGGTLILETLSNGQEAVSG